MDITVARAALIGSIEHSEMFVAEMSPPLLPSAIMPLSSRRMMYSGMSWFLVSTQPFQAVDDRVGKHHITSAGEFCNDMREERLDTGRRAVSERDRTCRCHDGNLSIAVTV